MLHGLGLHHFRIYDSRFITFDRPTTVIVGPNAIGKTSIIEAIQLLSTGQSFRANKVDEMIQFDQELARIKTKLEQPDSEAVELEVILTHGEVQGKRTHKTLYSVNDVRRRKKDFIGHFFCVSFRPEDMRLIEGSPTRRRQFLDTPLSVLWPEYAQALRAYDQTLRRRNKLLEQVRERQAPETALTYWNLSLIKNGQLLQAKRQQFLYSFQTVQFPVHFEPQYQPSLISEDRIKQYQKKEIAAGHTLIGPHKDDFSVHLHLDDGPPRDISRYGSRGQQRLAVLWLKLAELTFLEQESHQASVLLLDDILSELDHDNRHYVTDLIGQRQTIITTTEPRIVEEIQAQTSEIQAIDLE